MGKQDFSTFLPYIILKSFPTFRVWAIFLHMSLVLNIATWGLKLFLDSSPEGGKYPPPVLIGAQLIDLLKMF